MVSKVGVDDDEMEEGEAVDLLLCAKTVSSSCGSTGRKDPLDCYFLQNPRYGARKSANRNLHDVAMDILKDRAVAAFPRWVYNAGLPLNCVKYTDTFGAFIEVLDQFDLRMNSPHFS